MSSVCCKMMINFVVVKRTNTFWMQHKTQHTNNVVPTMNKNLIKIALICSILLWPIQSYAIFKDGNALYYGLIDSKRKAIPGEAEDNFGYVAGVVDATNRQPDPVTGLRFCVIENVKIEQLNEVILNYLRSHPGVRLYPAANLISAALSEKFPCR